MPTTLYEKHGLTKEEFRETLIKLYADDWSIVDIATKFGVSPAAIHAWKKKLGVDGRRTELRDSSWLEHNYLVLQRSAQEIAEELGVTPPAVRWYLKKFGIRTRSFCDAQKLASKKRYACVTDYNTENNGSRSRGYCAYYHGIYCRSTGELLWLLKNYHRYFRIKAEPFVYRGYKPDFLVDNKFVVEIKDSISSLDTTQLHRYQTLGQELETRFGYQFNMLFMKDLYPTEYVELKHELKERGAQCGKAIVWA